MNKKTWIDGMKGIAICGVVMIHSGGAFLPSLLGKIGLIGQNGVQIFFLLSAYLTFESMERSFADGMERKRIIIWMIKKFIRLIPLYYIALFVCYFTTGGNSYWLGSEGHITLGNLLAHMAFLHGLFPHYTDSIIGVEWYLGVLAIFYLIAPFLFKMINSLKKSVVFWVFGTFLGMIVTRECYRFIPQVSDSYIYTDFLGTFSFLTQISVILLGIVLYYILKEKRESKNDWETKLASYSLLLFAIVMIGGMVLDKNRLLGLNNYALFGIWFFIIACSQAMYSTPIIDNIVFRYLGRYSYSIFLFHYLLILIYQKYIHIELGGDVLEWLVKYIVVLGTSAVIAYFATRFVDVPIRNYLLKKLGI